MFELRLRVRCVHDKRQLTALVPTWSNFDVGVCFWGERLSERVAVLLASLGGGGAERAMVDLARGFADRGLQVDVVTGIPDGANLARVPRSVRLIDLETPRARSLLRPLMRYLRRERPRFVLSALEHVNLMAIWARRLADIPTRLIVTVHSMVSMEHANAPTIAGWLMLPLVRRFYPLADVIVAVSEGAAADLTRSAGIGRRRVEVVYNPVVTPELLASADRRLGHPWFQAGQPPVIVGVGRLTRAKDFPTLLRAFATVRGQQPARLLILGEGEERHGLEALARQLGIERDAALPGFVENAAAYVARSAVFVLSSAWEALPTVLIEAMAVGTPVVSTDCRNGPAEILRGGSLGKLVPVGDVSAMAAAISGTLRHPPGTEELRRRAQQFSLDASVESYLRIMGLSA